PAARSRSEIDYNEGGLAEKQKVGIGRCDIPYTAGCGRSNFPLPHEAGQGKGDLTPSSRATLQRDDELLRPSWTVRDSHRAKRCLYAGESAAVRAALPARWHP